MTAPQRATLACGALWVPLACWQCLQAYRTCASTDTTTVLWWTLLALAMVTPLVPIVRWSRRGSAGAPLVLLLAVYVPLTLALSLVQRCGR